MAFDAAGHDHIRKSLHTHPIPSKLRNLTISLQENNQTQIVTKTGKTKKILCRRGVFQGAGLSPFIFNIAVDHIFTTLSESQVAEKFGFKVADGLPKQSICGFADDTNLMSSSLIGIKQLAIMAINLFEECGFEINFQKSTLIAIEKGVNSYSH